jgi:outer membrane protein
MRQAAQKDFELPSRFDEQAALVVLNDPKVLAAHQQLESAQFKLRGTRAEAWPKADFSVNRYFNGRPGQALPGSHTMETLVTVSINVPVFDGRAQHYRVKASDADVRSRTEELREAERRVTTDLLKARDDFLGAGKAVQASAALARSAGLLDANARARYLRGLIDVTEVLNTQLEISRARKQEIQTMSELLRARMGLRVGLGWSGAQDLAQMFSDDTD